MQAGRPTTLLVAIGLARLYEAWNLSQGRTSPLVQPNKVATTNQPTIPVWKMSPTELQERRNKGLCYSCNEKFSPRHRRKKLFVIEARLADGDSDLVMEENEAND